MDQSRQSSASKAILTREINCVQMRNTYLSLDVFFDIFLQFWKILWLELIEAEALINRLGIAKTISISKLTMTTESSRNVEICPKTKSNQPTQKVNTYT